VKLEELFPKKLFRHDNTGNSPAFFWLGESFILTPEICAHLERASEACGNANVRICVQKSKESPLQEMVVLLRNGKTVSPHMHPNKSEIKHMIKGEMDLVFFSAKGDILQHNVVSPDGNCFITVAPSVYHEDRLFTPFVIFHEVKIGPFERDIENFTAPWI